MDTKTISDLFQGGVGNQNFAISAKNYEAVQEANRKGIDIEEMMKKIPVLESKLKDLDEKLSRSNQEEQERTFDRMYAEVKGHPDVRKMHENTAHVKSVTIDAVCMNYPDYRKAKNDERSVVERVYSEIEKKDGKGTGGILRDNTQRESESEKGIETGEEVP